MDFEEASTPMGPSGPYSKLIYHDSMVYKGWIGSKFNLVHKDILVIMQSCTRDGERGI